MASICIGTVKYDGLNGVNRQPTNGLKFNRQQSKNFFPPTVKMKININRQKAGFMVFQISLF